MKHIRKKDSSREPGWAYTVVITEGYGGDGQPTLEEHPSVATEPDVFEIVDEPLPELYQLMTYVVV